MPRAGVRREDRGNRHSAFFTLRDPGVLIPLGSGPSADSNSPVSSWRLGLSRSRLRNPTGPSLSLRETVILLSSQDSWGIHLVCLPSAGLRLVLQRLSTSAHNETETEAEGGSHLSFGILISLGSWMVMS